MKREEILQLKEVLSSPQNIVIVGHKNPDGDAIGSTLGLHIYLKKLGHKSNVIVPNEFPDFLKWAPENDSILVYDKNKETADSLINKANLIFTLDFNSLSRCGSMQEVLENASATFVMIDHHQEPDSYADYMYSDVHICSTAQMVYHFIDFMGDIARIDDSIATNLYTGIMTDTGSFRFRSTTSTTHRVVADLIDKGADNTRIHQLVFDTYSPGRMQLLGTVLQNMRVLEDFHTAYITLSQEELDRFNFQKGDTEGFVNYALSLQGIIFAAIFIESKNEDIVKISFRSKGDFSVNDFARKHFEGGGHINAAGGRSHKSLEDTVSQFISILDQYKDDIKNEI